MCTVNCPGQILFLDKIFLFPAINIYCSFLEDFRSSHIDSDAARARLYENFPMSSELNPQLENISVRFAMRPHDK